MKTDKETYSLNQNKNKILLVSLVAGASVLVTSFQHVPIVDFLH